MKKIGLVLASCIMFFSVSFMPLVSTSAATLYSDIPGTHRAYQEIYYLAQSDITTSDKTNIFAPDAPMTRAHAAAMIGKAIQLQGEQVETRFSDVKSSHFASGYINEAVYRNIILGYSDGTYRPDETLKRGEMALLISRAFGYRSTNVSEAANELMVKGISQGTGKGNFGTGDLMKRGDFAVFLARAVNAGFRAGGEELQASPMYVDVDESTSLNMRKGPSTAYTNTKLLFAGNQVDVFYRVGEWVYAKVGKDYGFLHGAFLATDSPAVSTVKDPEDLITEPVQNGKKTIDQLVVIIDPGHGAQDPGGTGFGLREKDVVLDISLRAKKYFQQTPIPVKLTREKDVFLELSERVKFAHQNKGDIFISVHTNAFNGKANGIETFYHGAASNPNIAQSKALTTYIHKRMLEAWNVTNRGVQSKAFYVIRENTMPATLVEAGFIDNAKDNAYIASPTHRESMARAIFLGTLDYYYHYEGRSEFLTFYTQFNAKPSAK